MSRVLSAAHTLQDQFGASGSGLSLEEQTIGKQNGQKDANWKQADWRSPV